METIVGRASALAIRWHTGQTRSNGEPYIHHPISVVTRLTRYNIVDDVTLAVGYCHDLLEDTHCPVNSILELGTEVLTAVQQLTKVKNISLFEQAKSYNDVAKCVKIADRLDNVYDSVLHSSWEPQRVKQYARQGLELLRVMLPWPTVVVPLAQDAWRIMQCVA